ncbi:hypothetical protein EGT74_02140 [Chitinophaga lutea]|uniref:Uncharacterized protein n=1 Tax=Chitinophaga lutea TaxID=2488634 RepID=A0A3N4QKW5_9BACT|nr:hypothetical protein EGT74_02140 [Chitinophaga lutea]
MFVFLNRGVSNKNRASAQAAIMNLLNVIGPDAQKLRRPEKGQKRGAPKGVKQVARRRRIWRYLFYL